MENKITHSFLDLDISSDNPFGKDPLGRMKFANLLTSISRNYHRGFVMAINGAWGTGKTVFINQWKTLLKKQGFNVSIFNAWENDYFGEPTIAILSQFRDFFSEDKNLTEKALAAWKTIQSVPMAIIKGRIKNSVSKIITDESLKDIEATYNCSLAKDIDYKESDITRYLLHRIDFLKYKNALIDFTSEIARDRKPLVFIIDELDRCTPSYAVEVLEKIKHLFNIPNIVFCLAIDKQQLIKSIQGHYGSYNFNGEEYLRRFFDVELELPKISYFNFALLLSNHFEMNTYILSENDLYEFNRLTAELAENQNLTLRQLEKFYSHAKLVFSYYSIGKDEWVTALMIILHKFDNETFESIRRRHTNLEQYARKLKPFFDMSEDGTGGNKLGAILYYIDVYLNIGHIVAPDEDFKFKWSYEFSEKQLDSMAWCYIAESKKLFKATRLDKIINKILFLEQHISK